ncbi:hypothetical protein BOTBODRAFT_39693 [Botryobasidium botryosum FD-172 SS1]|uniref:Uncharacterized protein n=1 Tax=Botryobasidium botryosum (strain FD-172 SS1) TaxID=930990 RepID=A0A067LSP6_BOTB1|nr:hypothetical protein BOTBODRAFT_39693 [Botryobasidium botryosum FD-172 SS1]
MPSLVLSPLCASCVARILSSSRVLILALTLAPSPAFSRPCPVDPYLLALASSPLLSRPRSLCASPS